MIGQTVSHYRIEAQLGKGGMGVVYQALDTRLDRTVALKFLPPHLSSDESAMTRFMAEAKAASALDDPYICTIYDIGETADEQLFIVMSYYDGDTLKYQLDNGPVPFEDAISIARQLTRGLATAHAAGIVHRDVKPANIMVTSSGQVKLLDFGVAKFNAAVDLTQEGTSVGTAAYMSPEQSRGEAVDGRADIWSVGAVLYEMLAGSLPFTGGYDAALLYAILNETPTPLEEIRPDLDPALCAVVDRCLSRDPADRFESAAALWEALVPFAPLTSETRIVNAPAASTGDTTAALIRTAAIFCVIAGVVLGGVYGAMMGLGLPGWLFPAGVILMLVGLPIVLYAVHAERSRAKLDSKERARLSGIKAWLTTRRAVRGGFAALGGLAAVTALFTVLRIMGVGPFATLISAGQIGEESVIVVTDFENRTDDPALGTSVTQAFRIDLSQSTAFNLMDGSRVTAALVRMQRDPASPISNELGREIAVREGAKAYIVGDIGAVGSGYVLTAGIHLASDGSQLVGLRESAASDADILSAIDKLSGRLREKVGESLVDIRADKPLRQVTTGSLKALRLYSEAEFLTRDDNRGAIRKLEEALAIDSTFAMAWRKLSIVHSNVGDPRRLRVEAARKAYQYRAKATERERLKIDALYYARVENDPERVISLYETLLDRWPYDDVGLINLQVFYNWQGRFAETEQMSRRALASNDGWVFRNALVRSLQAQGKYDEVRRALADWSIAFPRSPGMTGREITQAWLDNRPDTVRVLVDSLRVRDTSQDSERRVNVNIMSWAAETGRAQRYFEMREWDIENDAARGSPPSVLRGRLAAASFRLRVLKDVVGARSAIDRALELSPLDSLSVVDRPYERLAELYALLGDIELSNRLLDEYDEFMPSRVRGDDRRYRIALAQNKLFGGDAEIGIAELESIAAEEFCDRRCNWILGNNYERVGRTDDAIAALERAVTMPDSNPRILRGATSMTFERLGDHFATTGDLDKAIEYLSLFVEWWQDADPELQPRVQAARDRIEQLLARKSGEPSAIG